MPIGFDVGTYTLVCCTRGEKDTFNYDREVNAFIEIPLDDPLVYQMMRSVDVPVIKRGKKAYAVGEKAVRIAYSMPALELKRPMHAGCVNPKEKDAFEVMNTIIHSLLEGNVKEQKEVLYYCIPANAINDDTDADYHAKVLQSMFNAYESENKCKVDARPINEGLALVYAELKTKNLTGIGISFGAGMVNLCYAMFGVPVFQFALVNSGDWIDERAAKSSGESITFINQEKTKLDLTKEPTTLVERAIKAQYEIMVSKTVTGIKEGLSKAGKKARADKPVDVVIAGGTSMPKGFDLLFKEVIKQAELTIEIGSIVRPDDPLYSVSRGCLVAAEKSLE